MQKLIATCLLTPIFFVLSSAAHAILIPACPVSAGVYEYKPNVDGTDWEGCAVPADTYAFTLHRAGLCRSFVSFPDDASGSRDSRNATLFPPQHPARVLGSDCVTVFESASGASVVINAAGETTISGGTLTPPPLGETYTHVFAVVGKNLTYATTKTFSVSQTSTGGKGSGVKCWTEAGSFTVSAIPGGTPSILPRVRCGSADAPLTDYGSITQVTDCFEPGAGPGGLVEDRCYYQLDTGNNVAVWLTDATNLQKVTSTGAVERLVFVQRLASPLSGEISNLNLGFSTTQAVGLLGSNAFPNTVSYATQGNFVFRVTTR